jgi:peptidoglycan/LPS O-acetylase OafA/YrhL
MLSPQSDFVSTAKKGDQPRASNFNGSHRIPELDGLRGIAILLVLVYHFVGGDFSRTGVLPSSVVTVIKQSWIGVDLFFVLSGFLIGGILIDSRRSPQFFKSFYVRRFFRIVPLYWLLFALSLIVLAGILPGFPKVARSEVPWYAFLTFTQNFWTAQGRPAMVPFMGLTWSLAVEEQFYLAIPVLIHAVREKYLPWLVLGFVVMAPVLRLVLYYYLTGDIRRAAPYELTPCRADALGLGVLAAIMLRKPQVWQALVERGWLLNAALAVLALGMPYFIRANMNQSSLVNTSLAYTWIALFFLCLLLIAVTQKQAIISRPLRARALMATGGLAYCLYLFHTVFSIYAHALLSPHLPPTATAESIIIVLSVVLSFIFAKLSWKYFEKPLIDRAHQFRT